MSLFLYEKSWKFDIIYKEGHYRYYGVSGNFQGIVKFYRYVVRALYKMLSRRSQRRYLNWERYFKKLKRKPILKPKLYTSVW